MTDFWGSWWLPVLLAAAAVVAGGFLWLRLAGRNEKGAHRRISAALRRFASLRGYRVLDNLTLQTEKGPLQADHLLVGYFGILVVSDLCQSGDYYGKIDDPTWACNTRGTEENPGVRKGSVPNPLPEHRRFIEQMRSIFSKNGVYNISIDSLVVAADPRTTLYITGRGDRVLTLGELRGFLGKNKYSQDNGLDVEKLCKLLQP